MNKIFFSRFLILVSILFLCNNANAQYIVAGAYTPDDIYVDLIPDSVQKAEASHWSPYPPYSYSMDLDSNGILDLEFLSSGGGGLGGGGGGSGIEVLDPFVEIAAHWETSIGCCPTTYVELVADPINALDTISSQINYYNDFVYLWATSYGAASGPAIDLWNNIGIHYIGFRLSYPGNIMYGWIKINVTYNGEFNLYIMEYACNRNTTNMTSPGVSPEFVIYPTTFGEVLHVNIAPASVSRLTLYNAEGRKVIEKNISGRTSLPADFLSQGIYFYELASDEIVIGRGKLFKK